MTEPTTDETASSWYDDAPITDEQYASIWDSAMAVQERPNYSRHVVRKLLAEVDCLRAHLVAEHLAAEAAETENDRLRAQLAEIGETEVEWAVRWHEDGDVSTKRHTEAEARERGSANRRTMTTVSRIVGEWQDAK